MSENTASTETAAPVACPLTYFAFRNVRPPKKVTLKDGSERYSILGKVYGQLVDPKDPTKLGLYESEAMVSFLVNLNSPIVTQIAQGTVMYVPAQQINAEPSVHAQDGTPIHNFRGLVVGQILFRQAPAALQPTLKTVQTSALLSAQPIEDAQEGATAPEAAANPLLDRASSVLGSYGG